jgi:threonine dehydratase
MLFEFDDLNAARALVATAFAPTPQYAWPLLGDVVSEGQAPVEVWVKHENHTPVGAFKVRGGLVYLDRASSARPAATTARASPMPGGRSASRS